MIQFDTGRPLPKHRRTPKYPEDEKAVEQASAMIEAGSKARPAILAAIDRTYPVEERSAEFDLGFVDKGCPLED